MTFKHFLDNNSDRQIKHDDSNDHIIQAKRNIVHEPIYIYIYANLPDTKNITANAEPMTKHK
jgi:hypothetical protein